MQSHEVEQMAKGVAQALVIQSANSQTPQNLLNGFIGGILNRAPKVADVQTQNIFIDAVLKVYDEFIMPIDFEKVPNVIEGVLKRALRTVLRETLEHFFAESVDVPAQVGGGDVSGDANGGDSAGVPAGGFQSPQQ
jgi:hypothetical protein